MRKLIAAMKTSVDGKIEGADGYADWVDAWSEDYGLTSQIDACLLGGRMGDKSAKFLACLAPAQSALPRARDVPLSLDTYCVPPARTRIMRLVTEIRRAARLL